MELTAVSRDVTEWLEEFARAVRERDFEAGRRLCSDAVTGFGTVSSRYRGIDELHDGQWQPVWDRTEGFAFDADSVTVWADGSLTVVIGEWSSVGRDVDGSGRPRRGRATIVLADADGALRAVHTHFSMAPGFDP